MSRYGKRVAWVVGLAAISAAALPSSASAEGVTLSGPQDNAVFTSPASVAFSATRNSSGCTLADTAADFAMYIKFPGAQSFDIFERNISGEGTISRTLPLSGTGTWAWKGTLTCRFDGMGNAITTESETRTFTLRDPDLTPPNPTLSGKLVQRVGTKLTIKVACDEPCDARATGELKIPGGSSLSLKAATVSIAAGAQETLGLKVPKSAQRRAKRAVEDGATPRAKLEVVVVDAAGNEGSEKRTVKLK